MRLRSALVFVFAIAGIATALFAKMVLMIPSQDEIAQKVATSWYETTHDHIVLNSPLAFSIFPRPELILQNPEIRTGNGVAIKAERIAFGLDIISAIVGDYHISSMTIEGGEATIPTPLNSHDRIDTERLVKAIVHYFDDVPTKAKIDSLVSVTVRNLKIDFRTPDSLAPLILTDGTLQVQKSGAFEMDAQAMHHDIPFQLKIAIDAPAQDSKREREALFSYRDDALSLSGKGMIATQPDVQFIGPVSLQSGNISRAAERFLDQKNPALEKTATMQADARLSFSAMTLSQMMWTIGKAKLNGNMLVDLNRPTPRITGTLAASEMDLSEFIDHIGFKRDSLGHWSNEKFNSRLIPDLDLDLRMSSELVMLHDVTVKSMAISMLLQDKKLEVSLASADIFDGSISGKINISPLDHAGRKSVKINAEFNQIDLERSILTLIDSKRVTGLASGQINLEAEGQSSVELVESLSGLIDADASRITFSGVNLLNFLHRVEQRPLGAGIALKNGTTEFDTMQLTLSLAKGVGTFKTANFTRLPDLQIKLGGSIDVAGQTFAIAGHALGASATDANQSINLPFVLKGPFDNPAFLPDFINVSKQAGAIAP